MKMAARGAAVAVCHAEPAPSLSRTQDYGGYLSTSILPARDANQGPMFACGAALSPITDFRLHGTVGRSVSAQGWGGKPSPARGPQVLPRLCIPPAPAAGTPEASWRAWGQGGWVPSPLFWIEVARPLMPINHILTYVTRTCRCSQQRREPGKPRVSPKGRA